MKKSVFITIIVILIVALAVLGYMYYTNNKTESNTVYGSVISENEDSIALDVDGNVYNINIKSATKIPDDAKFEEKDIVKIQFKGKLENNVLINSIEIISSSSSNIPSSENNPTGNTTTNTTNDPNKEYYISGEVVDIHGDRIDVNIYMNNKTYKFDISKAEKSPSNTEIKIGDSVKIVHKGHIDTNNTNTMFEATYISELDKNDQAPTITGTIIDATTNVLSLDVNGTTYSFLITDAKKGTSGGLTVGKTVTIVYTGTLSEIGSNIATEIKE